MSRDMADTIRVLRAAFIIAALDAGPLREYRSSPAHTDPRTTIHRRSEHYRRRCIGHLADALRR